MYKEIMTELRPNWVEQMDYRIVNIGDKTVYQYNKRENNAPTQEEIDALIPKYKLLEAKQNKKIEIRTRYEVESVKPVTWNGVTFQGGFDSAIKLDAAKRLAEAAGQPYVIFFDDANNGHSYTFADAMQIIVGVSVAFQTAFAKKQVLFTQIDEATTVDEINSISW